MHVNGYCVGVPLIVGTVFELVVSGTLLKTICKRCSGKDYTFLIAFESAAVTVVIFFGVATLACSQWLIQ
jgi:hypothetical protein